MIGERTLAALRAMGLGGIPLSEALTHLIGMATGKKPPVKGRRSGHFSVEGSLPEAFSSGAVQSVKTQTGYAVSVGGPGRLILLFGEN
jgi:hypothetical protein